MYDKNVNRDLYKLNFVSDVGASLLLKIRWTKIFPSQCIKRFWNGVNYVQLGDDPIELNRV